MPELAGRELDTEVARVVFGYKVIWSRDVWGVVEPCIPGTSALSDRKISCYSANMSDAWLVVERMRELGYHAIVRWHHKAEATFYKTGEGKHGYTVVIARGNALFADTAMVAICEAALKAIGNATPHD